MRTASKTSSSKRDFFSPCLWLAIVALMPISFFWSASLIAEAFSLLVVAIRSPASLRTSARVAFGNSVLTLSISSSMSLSFSALRMSCTCWHRYALREENGTIWKK